MKEFTPNIKIPMNDPNELENAIRRQWAGYASLMHRGSWDTLVETGQALANVDFLLDHYPNGVNRELAAKTGRISLEQLGEAE